MFLFLSFEQVHFICVRLTYFQSLRACVSEVIQSIDDQLFKQEDLQKKKVPSVQFHVLQILGWLVFNWGINAMCNSYTREHVAKYGSWHPAEFCQLLFFFFQCPFDQVSVLRLIQVVRSVEKIEKILHSQNSKEANSLESRWETMVFIRYCSVTKRNSFTSWHKLKWFK